jgi:hypothetical protein
MSESTLVNRFSEAVNIVVISPALPVEISPAVVACCTDGGGGGTIVVEISPAKADRASARVNTDTAQNCRKVFICFSWICVLLLLPKVF